MTREKRVLAIIEDTDKNFSPYYDFLPALIRERDYKFGIEVGVFCGGHALAMLDTDIDFLVGVDPYEMFPNNQLGLNNQEDWDCMYRMVMDRLSDERYLHIRKPSDHIGYLTNFDFVFIDGLHTYDQVTKDLDRYSKFIRPGGVVACHDYNHPNFPGVTTAILEFAFNHKLEIVEGPLYAIYMDWV